MKRLAGAALTMFVLACGSDDPPSGQELCQQTSRIICGLIFDCSEGAPYREVSGGTEPACIETLDQPCLDSPTACAPGDTYHPDKGEACVAALRATTCADLGASSDLNATLSPVPCNETCTTP